MPGAKAPEPGADDRNAVLTGFVRGFLPDFLPESGAVAHPRKRWLIPENPYRD
jgi:hypothetical protein